MENHNNERENASKLRNGWLKENKVLAGIILLGLIMVACFIFTWVFPRSPAEKPNVTPSPSPAGQNQDISQVITDRVTQIEGVKGTSVIVLSRVALIALEVEAGTSPTEIKRIKNEAGATAKGEPGIDEVLVTANPDLVAEVKKILEGEVPLERLQYIYESIRDQKI